MASSIYQNTGPGRPPVTNYRPPPPHPQQMHSQSHFQAPNYAYPNGPLPPPPPYGMGPPGAPAAPSQSSQPPQAQPPPPGHPGYGSAPAPGAAFGPPGVAPSHYQSQPPPSRPYAPGTSSSAQQAPAAAAAQQQPQHLQTQHLPPPPAGQPPRSSYPRASQPSGAYGSYPGNLQSSQAANPPPPGTGHNSWGGSSAQPSSQSSMPKVQQGQSGALRGPFPTAGTSNSQQTQVQKQASLPASDKGRIETESERRERKRREYELKKMEHKQREKLSTPGPSGMTKHSSARERFERKHTTAEKIENRLKRPSTFLCKIKFRNELPDPVSQPKLLHVHDDKDQYTKYAVTAMEKSYKHKLFVEPDLGIPLDLLDISVYNAPSTRPAMDPADAELLVDDEVTAKEKTESIRRKERPTDKGVAWLVKTTYISPVNTDPAKQSLTEKQAKELREQKEGRRDLLEGINDREQQIQAIEESFKISKQVPTHQSKPELIPVEILPLIPDFERVGDKFVHAVFDTDPTAESELHSKLDRKSRDELESRAILKSYSIPGRDGARPEKFISYMVPRVEELQTDAEDEALYSWVREYHWDLRTEDARNTYVFWFGDDSVHYLPLGSKLLLQKKKAKEGRSKDEVENQFPVPSSVTLRRRELSDDEEEQRESRREAFMEGRVSAPDNGQSSKRKRSPPHGNYPSKHRVLYEDVADRELSEDEVSV